MAELLFDCRTAIMNTNEKEKVLSTRTTHPLHTCHVQINYNLLVVRRKHPKDKCKYTITNSVEEIKEQLTCRPMHTNSNIQKNIRDKRCLLQTNRRTGGLTLKQRNIFGLINMRRPACHGSIFLNR